jgi:hypothetical protein
MTKRMTSQTQAGGFHRGSALPLCAVAFFATSILAGCGDSSTPTSKKDSAIDQAKDTANNAGDSAKDVVSDTSSTGDRDLSGDAGGCFENGQFYSFGATVIRPGDCPATCTCLSTGSVGQCTTSCPTDATVPDTRAPIDVAPSDSPITCTRAGKSYNPGEEVPLGDGCGGTCVCLTSGTLGACSPACAVDAGPDLPKDTNKDQSIYDLAPPVDVPPAIDAACVAGAACSLANGNKGFCAAGACTACAGAADDTDCRTAYGTGNICISGSCTAGDCHDSVGCSTGRLCGSSVAHACGDCTTDAQCTGDAHYGAGHLCVNNLCVPGNCHDTSADCTGTRVGQVCGVTTAHTCGACTSDTQCANDATYAAAPAKPICTTTAGQPKVGQCVANPTTVSGSLCTSDGVVCPANSADFCCGNKCVPGNCCDESDCASLGSDFVCRQNTCTRCDSVAGNAYFVDPVGGDDTTATGSGTSGGTAATGCSFRTLTQALTVIGNPTTATTITIVGRTTGSTAVYTAGENPPIQVPANVTITTKTGPVTFTPGATKTGFILVGNNSGIAPISDARLTIQGGTGAGGKGIVVTTTNTTDVVKLQYVTVNNAGSDGIQITKGTANFLVGVSVTNAGANGINISGTGVATMNAGLSVTDAGAHGINVSGTGTANIGAGVTVTGSGTTANPANGLNISGGGTATITVGASATSTAFDSNSQFGIAVADTGVLTITGAVPTTGSAVRTVSAKNNTDSNVRFDSTGTSSISYFYSYGSQADGLVITAGSDVQVRHSVFRGNAGDGIHVISSASSNDLGTIDLGTSATTAANAGNNELQSAVTANRNAGAGLCVQLTLAAAAAALNAMGNQFANGVNCTATNPGAITKSAACTNGIDLGIDKTNGPASITVNTDACTHAP